MESAPTVFTYVPHIKSRYFNFFATVLKGGPPMAAPTGLQKNHPFSCRGDHWSPAICTRTETEFDAQVKGRLIPKASPWGEAPAGGGW